MNEDIYSDLAIEQACKNKFGLSVDIAEVVVRGIPVGITAQATLFKTTNGQMFLYVTSQATQLLDDVQKIVSRMNLEAEHFLPPNNETEYFDRIGRDKFKGMFPGKPIASPDDLRYYRNLAPYNPALVRIAQVKGEVRAYDPQSRTWHKAKNYAYSKIKTI
jgi:hypothetical protein